MFQSPRLDLTVRNLTPEQAEAVANAAVDIVGGVVSFSESAIYENKDPSREEAPEPKSHVTKNNPSGSVQRCERRDIHGPHEWQAEFGAYFDVYCPGNSGLKP